MDLINIVRILLFLVINSVIAGKSEELNDYEFIRTNLPTESDYFWIQDIVERIEVDVQPRVVTIWTPSANYVNGYMVNLLHREFSKFTLTMKFDNKMYKNQMKITT